MKEGRPSHGFFDKAPEHAAARATYLKIFLGGSFLAVIIIFSIFPIFWGALWKTPVYHLSGWIVVRFIIFDPLFMSKSDMKDFDGGLIGQGAVQALTTPSPLSKISWTVVPASHFPGGVQELSHAVLEEKAWVAVSG
jgi:hypothetical protein